MPRVTLSVVGGFSSHFRDNIAWPDGWPVPRIDEQVSLYCVGCGDEHTLHVRTVVWTLGEDEAHVYVVVGERRLG